MRRHLSMLDDLAATMSGAGAGAVFFGSGAYHELRWRGLKQRYYYRRKSFRDYWAKCLPGYPACPYPDTLADQH
jgi:hypothetical protein